MIVLQCDFNKYSPDELMMVADQVRAAVTEETVLAIAELALPVKIDGDLAASLTVSNKSYAGEILYFEKSSDAKKYADYKKENSSSYVKKDGKAVFVGDKEAYKMKAAE